MYIFNHFSRIKENKLSGNPLFFAQLEVEVPPLASIPFPPPLDEGMTEEMWREHVMTPPQSPQPEEQTEVRIALALTELI